MRSPLRLRLGECLALAWVAVAALIYTFSGQWRTQRIFDDATHYLPFFHVVLFTLCIYFLQSALTSARRLQTMASLVRRRRGEPSLVVTGPVGLDAELDLLKRMARFARDCAPVYAFLLFYPSSDFLIDWLQGAKLADARLAQADLLIFGVHLSVWAERFISSGLTDLLSLCYFLHMILPPLIVLVIALRGPRSHFVEVVDAFVLMSVIGVTTYVLVPAVGPKYHLAGLYSRDLAGGMVTMVNQAVVEATRVPRDAFPSLHVGISALLLFHAWKSSRWFAVVLAPFVVGNWLATIYLRYHYTVDVVAGFLLVPIVQVVVVRWNRRFSPLASEGPSPPAVGAQAPADPDDVRAVAWRSAWGRASRPVFVIGTGLFVVCLAVGAGYSLVVERRLPSLGLDPLAEARRASERGDFARASAEYREIVALMPGDVGLLLASGYGLATAHDYSGALEAYSRARRLRPRSPEVLKGLASAFAFLHRFPEAEQTFAQVLTVAPNDSDALAGLGGVWLEENRLKDAEAALSRAVALDPANATAYNDLGIALALQGRHEAAAQQFEKALILKPSAQVADNLARAKAAASPPGLPGRR